MRPPRGAPTPQCLSKIPSERRGQPRAVRDYKKRVCIWRTGVDRVSPDGDRLRYSDEPLAIRHAAARLCTASYPLTRAALGLAVWLRCTLTKALSVLGEISKNLRLLSYVHTSHSSAVRRLLGLPHALVARALGLGGVAAAARPLAVDTARPCAPPHCCTAAALAPKGHKRSEATMQDQIPKLALVFLLLEAMQHNRSVAECAVDGRWPRVVLHHKGRVDECNALIMPLAQLRHPHSKDAVAHGPAPKVGLARPTRPVERRLHALSAVQLVQITTRQRIDDEELCEPAGHGKERSVDHGPWRGCRVEPATADRRKRRGAQARTRLAGDGGATSPS